MFPIAKPGKPLSRGIYVMPCMGATAPIILFAVRSNGVMLGELVPVPFGSNSVAIADELWERLEREDPDPRQRLRAI
jgi:hypothetical protein